MFYYSNINILDGTGLRQIFYSKSEAFSFTVVYWHERPIMLWQCVYSGLNRIPGLCWSSRLHCCPKSTNHTHQWLNSVLTHTVHFYITAEKGEIKPLRVSKNKILSCVCVCVLGLSPPVKKTELDSPSPQEDSPRLGSFTQHHRPVIAVHSGQ